MQGLEGDAAAPVLADDAHQVQHRRAALDGGGKSVRLQHVPRHAVDGLESLEVTLRAVTDEGSHEEALRQQGPDDVFAHETGAAGDEDALHRSEA